MEHVDLKPWRSLIPPEAIPELDRLLTQQYNCRFFPDLAQQADQQMRDFRAQYQPNRN